MQREREVDMAVRDPKTGRLTLGRETVEAATVHIRHNGQGADRIINDCVGGRVLIARGQTVTVELSRSGADDLRKQMESGSSVLELVEAP
jgi:hypothetical protein